LTFFYYNPTKRLSDLDNMCWIHCKFLQDALVELWYIKDDNYEYIPQIRYIHWWYRKNCETIEVLVNEFN
jgi:Holliday junction resolvase RusA-like endonuclease